MRASTRFHIRRVLSLSSKTGSVGRGLPDKKPFRRRSSEDDLLAVRCRLRGPRSVLWTGFNSLGSDRAVSLLGQGDTGQRPASPPPQGTGRQWLPRASLPGPLSSAHLIFDVPGLGREKKRSWAGAMHMRMGPSGRALSCARARGPTIWFGVSCRGRSCCSPGQFPFGGAFRWSESELLRRA